MLCDLTQAMAIQMEPCCDAGLAMAKLCHSKFEGVIVDLTFKGGREFLRKLRTLTSNKSAVSYAILGQDQEQVAAFQAGANFVFGRPLSLAPAAHVLKASYALMLREKRRYFRCPLQIAVSVSRGDAESTGISLNISEFGICLSSVELVHVGYKLQLRLRLPGNDDLLDLSGEVCWSEASGRCGVQFLNLKPGVAQRLRNWLDERLNESLSRKSRRDIACCPVHHYDSN